MNTVAEVRIPADEFVLETTLAAVTDAEFELVQMVACGDDQVMPFVWVTASEFERVERALEADSTVENVTLLADLGDERLYQMDWIARLRLIIYPLLEENGTILNAYGRRDQWYLRMLFPTRDCLSSTYDFCREHDLTLQIENIYTMGGSDRRGQYGLTREQHTALLAALERGYYDIPRTITLEELADQLDISHQALSERLRRGSENLLQNTLVARQGLDDPVPTRDDMVG